MIEQAHETERLTAYAAHLEAETQALRTLNDAMALVCERLLAPSAREGRRPVQTDPSRGFSKQHRPMGRREP
jgi:hypothetical protein